MLANARRLMGRPILISRHAITCGSSRLSVYNRDCSVDVCLWDNRMTEISTDTENLLQSAIDGNEESLAELFAHYRKRLRRMIQIRMDRRLLGRVDPSDVLQEAYLDLAKRLPDYAQDQAYPFFLWLRMLTGQRLMLTHRFHLQTAMRDAGQEVSLYHKAMPEANSMSLAANLLGRMTSVSEKAIRAEVQVKLQETLNSMDPMDREILVLRHFEELTNGEAAEVLGIKKAAASNRHMRALKRLKETLQSVPGMLDR